MQHPDEAPAPAMPLNAVLRDHVDWVLPVTKIPDLLVRLVHGARVEPDSSPRSREPSSSRAADPARPIDLSFE